MNPLDMVSGAPWKSVAFTTYALSLSFFESVVLDRLVRGGSRSALILADPEGVRSGLSEEGARRAGRDYDIEPVGCTTGVFHPKISVFASTDDAHILVGSGNLTFGGWGGNLEVVEHLHPSFAADAMADAADMFELLAMSERIQTEAGPAFIRLADTLRAANGTGTRTGAVRIIHSVGGSIGSEIARFADELGGARRITVVSPYHDLDGRGVDALSDLLSCHDVRIHVHEDGNVRGIGAVSWPFEGKRKRDAVKVPLPFKADGRLLHAKSIEIMCQRGRLLVAGSANSTHAGLFGANVEASVLRIQRQTSMGWKTSSADVPQRPDAQAADAGEETTGSVGVLRASLEGGAIKATVITPKVRGRVKVCVRTVRRTRELGYANIDTTGRLSIEAYGLEQEAWEIGRLVLRLEQQETVVEGFVAITAATELVRRAGPMATRLFAVLAGNETPADVAAMLAWFREDPQRLPRVAKESTASAAGDDNETSTFVNLGSLDGSIENIHHGDSGNGSAAWKNAMALLRSAFSTPRGPWNSERDDDLDDDDKKTNVKRNQENEQQNAKSIEHFEALLPKMLDSKSPGADPFLALTLTHFVADRIRPPSVKVRSWISQILLAIKSFNGSAADQALASLLVYYGTDVAPNSAARARRALLLRDVDPGTLIPGIFETIPAFMELLAQDLNPGEFIECIVRSKTGGEEVRAYLLAAAAGGPFEGSVLLSKSDQWGKLKKALTDRDLFGKFSVFKARPSGCPRCRMNLPLALSADLRQLGVTECCGRIILCEEI